MLTLATTLTLLHLIAPASSEAERVRIGLLSLFKPEAMQVRPAPGHSAKMAAADASESIGPSEIVRIRLAGRHLQVNVVDGYGRVRRSLPAGELAFTVDGPASLELILPGKLVRPVRGELVVSARKSAGRGLIVIVLITDRESATRAVVAAEMTSSRPPEALKAMAVLARTFMLAHPGRHAAEGFDFCDTTHCQVYRAESDLAPGDSSITIGKAVAATEGEYLSFRGRIVEGYYTAVCGGLAATPEMVWGGNVSSGYRYRRTICPWCQVSRYYRWGRSASASRVLDALAPAVGFRPSEAAEIRLIKDEQDEFVRSVLVMDRARQAAITADAFRRAVGRRLGWNTALSPSFAVERRGRLFIFRGRGFGSQVGMCVAGAAAQAKAGRGYKEILSYYYPDAEIAMR